MAPGLSGHACVMWSAGVAICTAPQRPPKPLPPHVLQHQKYTLRITPGAQLYESGSEPITLKENKKKKKKAAQVVVEGCCSICNAQFFIQEIRKKTSHIASLGYLDLRFYQSMLNLTEWETHQCHSKIGCSSWSRCQQKNRPMSMYPYRFGRFLVDNIIAFASLWHFRL